MTVTKHFVYGHLVRRSTARHWPKPTQAELEILTTLWERGPSTVKQVHQALAERRETGYTTVLKLMQIMAEKGLVVRDETLRAHVYHAAPHKKDMQGQLLDDLLERAFGGSAAQLVLHALSRHKATPQELTEIRRMLQALKA